MSIHPEDNGGAPPPEAGGDADDAVRLAVERAFGADSLSILDDGDEALAAAASSGSASASASASSGSLSSSRSSASASGSRAEVAAVDPLEALVSMIEREQGPGQSFASSAARAAAAAVHHAEPASPDSYVIFVLGGTTCAVPLSGVLEIQRPPATTWIPNLPDWVLGVANLRGEIISVIELRRYFGLPAAAHDESSRIVVVRSEDQELVAGLIVDRVVGITGIHAHRVASYTSQDTSGLAPYLRGAAEEKGRVVAMMDLEAFLQSRDMRQFIGG